MIIKADLANRACCRIHQNDRIRASNLCVFKQLPPRTAISNLRRISGFNLGQILDTVTFDQIVRADIKFQPIIINVQMTGERYLRLNNPVATLLQKLDGIALTTSSPAYSQGK